MPVDAVIEDQRWADMGLEALAANATDATLRHLTLDPAEFEISLLACDDTRIAALNADFRDRPRATNVLSWPSVERGADTPGGSPALPDPDGDPELGDIAIAFDTCKREAAEAGIAFQDHVTHLMVHGVLHLLGFDHETDADAELMEGQEVAILASLGIADPY